MEGAPAASGSGGKGSARVVDSHLHVWASPQQATDKYPYFRISLGTEMPGWMIRMVFLLNSWVIRILVMFSFTAHLLVVLLAGFRRHMAIGVPITILWTANQLGRSAATYALGKLALGSTPQELQLVTFWGAFLLLHAGGPDNLTAYSLEDNILSTRQKVEMFFQVIGAVYAMYKNIVVGSGSGTMVWVSSFMFILGIFKYWERSKAMELGNLENMRISIKKKKEEGKRSRRSLRNVWRASSRENYEEALLVAHGLLDITKGAFVDSSVDEHQIPEYAARRREIFPSSDWKMMYKVVDMELSLMYDILYTRTAMVHTWGGYAIRATSPFVTAAAFVLFWFDSKKGQRMVDVLITYVFLASTFIIDIRWFLRAVASTWTYFFLNDRPRFWFHHALLCSGKWRLLRRLIVSLDLSQCLYKEPSCYRKWSGKIGQYNLLQECTRDKDNRTSGYLSSVVMKVVSEDKWMEYEYHNLRGINISKDVKEKLFDCIWEYMWSAYPAEDDEAKKEEEEEKKKKEGAKKPEKKKSDPIIDELQGVKRVRELEEALDFLPEFQESILMLHITTDIILLYTKSEQHAASSKPKDEYAEAIKVLSNYMMFLVAVRSDMIPGLKLRSLYEATEDALAKIWRKQESSRCISRKEEKYSLADILRRMEKTRIEVDKRDESYKWRPGYRTRNWKPEFITELYNVSIVLSDGIKLAELLLQWLHSNYSVKFPKNGYESKFGQLFPKLTKVMKYVIYNDDPKKLARLLQHMFEEWVRLLINASVKCSRDSQAKQLSRGGELMTIVWILVEHAGIFRVEHHRR
uniref:DUF4220 domain-containing protein n=1 Tax=Leersia perrieri TaxID=77586 RepID=A0A0D9W224_9ORYZ